MPQIIRINKIKKVSKITNIVATSRPGVGLSPGATFTLFLYGLQLLDTWFGRSMIAEYKCPSLMYFGIWFRLPIPVEK